MADNADAFDAHELCVLACSPVLGFCRIFCTREMCALAMAAALTLRSPPPAAVPLRSSL